MFLDKELHSVSHVLKESGEDGFAHPRAVIDSVNGREIFITVAEVLVQPFIDRTDGFAESEWKHVPPFTGGDAVFTNPKRAQGSGGAVSVLHTSHRFSFNPENGELGEKQHQEHDVDHGEGGDGKRQTASAFLERSSFE